MGVFKSFEGIKPMQGEAMCFTRAADGKLAFWGTVETQQDWDRAKNECAFWVHPDELSDLLEGLINGSLKP